MHVVLTGIPGIGKTTLVKKASEVLSEKNLPFWGFYTEEERNNGRRVGFNLITLPDLKKGTLSNVNSKSKLRIGQYGVEIEEFEKLALPLLEGLETKQGILLIDEVGKMELFSQKFKMLIMKAFSCKNPNLNILCTIPVPKSTPIAIVGEIRHNKDSKLFNVDKFNRNMILEEIIQILTLNKS